MLCSLFWIPSAEDLSLWCHSCLRRQSTWPFKLMVQGFASSFSFRLGVVHPCLTGQDSSMKNCYTLLLSGPEGCFIVLRHICFVSCANCWAPNAYTPCWRLALSKSDYGLNQHSFPITEWSYPKFHSSSPELGVLLPQHCRGWWYGMLSVVTSIIQLMYTSPPTYWYKLRISICHHIQPSSYNKYLLICFL